MHKIEQTAPGIMIGEGMRKVKEPSQRLPCTSSASYSSASLAPRWMTEVGVL